MSTTDEGVFRFIGRAIERLRRRTDLAQADLAQAAGITKSMVSKYERGHQRPSLETLDRILVALGVDLFELATVLREVEAVAIERGEAAGDARAREGAERTRARTELVRSLELYLRRLEDWYGEGAQ